MNSGFIEVGFVRKRYEEILSDLHDRSRKEFGDGINVNDNSPLGKFLKIIAWHSAEMWEIYENGYYQNYLLSADGIGLDMWASNFGEARRLGSKATGEVTIKGTPGLRVNKGFRVSAGTDIVFETVESKSLDEAGQVNIKIEAVEVGTSYNIIADSIKNIVNPIVGITSVTNKEATTGGVNIENDDELRERLIEKMRTVMTGDNKNQYIYWAKQNEKVGTARVQRATPKPGYVTVRIATRDGNKASDELIKEVYDYIAPLQPTTTGLVVESLNAKTIIVSITGITLSNNTSLEQLRIELAEELNKYLSTTATKSNVVSLARVSHIVIDHPDILDFTGITLNGQMANVELSDEEIPTLEDVLLEVK